MGNKQTLFDLIKKCRDVLLNSREYMLCNLVLSKISASMLSCGSDMIEIDLNELSKLSKDEISVFTSEDSARIIASLGVLSIKKGWRVDTVIKLIKSLQQDILDNKMKGFSKNIERLNELYRVVEQELFLEHYKGILDFIKLSVENNLLSVEEGILLNFYILSECSVNKKDLQKDDAEVVNLKENNQDIDDVRNKIVQIFEKYGYTYDLNKMGDLDKSFVKYTDVKYLDYVLEKFRRYNIDQKTLYIRKRALYNIIVDNDKKAFDLILDFINNNNCSLNKLLAMPSIFALKKKCFVETEEHKDDNISVNNDNIFEVVGSQQDFLENIKLYKEITSIDIITDKDLEGMVKFLSTPTAVIKKNLDLLRRYKIVGKNNLPKSILSLCGNSTEYLIDRYIELGIYDEYLIPRYNNNGEYKEARGTCYLDKDSNPFSFYKLKMARDLGQNVFATNSGIRRVFRDDNESYAGISQIVDVNGSKKVVQEPFSLEFMRSLSSDVRRQLPENIQKKFNNGEVNANDVNEIYFDNLYRYRTVSPVEVFENSYKEDLGSLKGERVDRVFSKDYKRVLTDDEINNLEYDSFIAMLDNAVYCDVYGNSSRMKIDDLRYEFMHPTVPNVMITVSRYKVLRLCKLLKEDGCFINNNSSVSDKENTLLAILLKDMIVSEVEVFALKLAVKDILSDGLVRVSQITEKGRGAR